VTPVRVVLVEDNDVFREALELLLGMRGGIEIVGSDADGSRALELCRSLAPDVLVVDYRLPGRDGVEITRQVREVCPGVAVVALTAAAEAREIDALLEAGAVACLRKDEPLDTIADAVRAAGSSH
jgi:DNA-binding NarL/FixJ family response regulator